jgi:hypothetical protein
MIKLAAFCHGNSLPARPVVNRSTALSGQLSAALLDDCGSVDAAFMALVVAGDSTTVYVHADAR